MSTPREPERWARVLLTLLLIALVTSITAIDTLIAVLTVVAAWRLMRDPERRARYRFPLAGPLLVFAAITVLSAVASPDRAGALVQSRHLVTIAIFFIAVNEFGNGGAIRRALGWLYAAVIVAAVYAMLQTAACNSSAALPAWVARLLRVNLDACRHMGIEPFRAKAFFSIYMTLGGSLVVILSLLLAALVLGRGARGALTVAATTLGLFALALTYVRSAWLGLAVSVLVLATLARRWMFVVPLVVAAAIAVAVPSPMRGKALSMFDTSSPSASERIYFWEAGERMIRDAPLLGLGPGGVHRHYPAYKDPRARRPGTSHLHNNLVQIAAERGLLGLAAWLAIWIAFALGALRVYRALPLARAADRALVAGSLAGVAGFLVAGLFEYNFGDSEVIDLVWVVMAFPFIVGAADEPAAPASAPPRRVVSAASRS